LDGNIHLKYNNPYEPYTGLFSFAIYFEGSVEEFKNSPYFIGLLLYAEFIHKLAFFKETYHEFMEDFPIVSMLMICKDTFNLEEFKQGK
jgi:hypothetical protein